MAKMEEVKARRAHDAEESAIGNLATLEPLLQVGSRFIDTWLAVSAELLEFGKARLDRNLEAGRAIAQSTNFNEAFDAQAQFTRSTMQDYMAEANKLADLGTRGWLDGLSTLRHQTAHHGSVERAEAAE
jgi:hypothetical protein